MLNKESILPNVRWLECIILTIVMALPVAAYGLMEPYAAPFLRAVGLSTWQINLISGLALLTGIVIQPLLGALSDTLDARRPVIMLSSVMAATAMAFFPYVTGIWQFFILNVLLLNGYQYLIIVGGVIIGRIVGPDGSGDALSKLRVYGSLGYIVVAFVSGRLLPQHAGMHVADFRPIYIYGPALFLATGILSYWIPDPKRDKRAENEAFTQSSKTGKQRRSNHVPAPKLITKFLVAFVFYQAALYGMTGNLPLYVTEKLHGNPATLSTFFVVGVIAEVIMMFFIGRFTDLYGRRPALILAFVSLPIRILCYLLAPNALLATMVQALHGLNYGIIGTTGTTVINDCAAEHRRGIEQARYGLCASAATALGQWVCGYIVQHYGFSTMFQSMTLLAIIGACLMIKIVPESHPRFRTASISSI